MKKIYVILNRLVGSVPQRATDNFRYEMIVPIQNADGTWSSPKDLTDYWASITFLSYLEEGKTVLVNDKGGFNYLDSTDHIVKIWQE